MTVINTAPVRVFWKDRDLRYLGCNTAFAKDAGLEQPDDVIGKDDYQMVWADRAELYRADDKAVMESGIAKLSFEELMTDLSGQQFGCAHQRSCLESRITKFLDCWEFTMTSPTANVPKKR